jgi:hypothetical protein
MMLRLGTAHTHPLSGVAASSKRLTIVAHFISRQSQSGLKTQTTNQPTNQSVGILPRN